MSARERMAETSRSLRKRKIVCHRLGKERRNKASRPLKKKSIPYIIVLVGKEGMRLVGP